MISYSIISFFKSSVWSHCSLTMVSHCVSHPNVQDFKSKTLVFISFKARWYLYNQELYLAIHIRVFRHVSFFLISFILNIQNEHILLTIQKLQFFASDQLLCLLASLYLLVEFAFEHKFLLFQSVQESINF